MRVRFDDSGNCSSCSIEGLKNMCHHYANSSVNNVNGKTQINLQMILDLFINFSLGDLEKLGLQIFVVLCYFIAFRFQNQAKGRNHGTLAAGFGPK
jgi:hypothetical protein